MNAGTIRSLLFGSKLRSLGVIVLLLAGSFGGAFFAGVIGAPSVEDVRNQFGDVNRTATEVETGIVVSNPNPIGANLNGLSVNYSVAMNDVRVANGSKRGVSIGTGTTTVNTTTLMYNDGIPDWWVSHVRNGERTTVRVDATARSSTLGRTFSAPPITESVNTDIISKFNSTETRRVDANNALVRDPVLYVNRTSASWGAVSADRTPIDMTFAVHNPKVQPLTVTEIGYTVTMNDITVGEGATDGPHLIEGRTGETIRAQTAIDNSKLDEWWVSHLERNQHTDLRIEFYAKVDLGGETFRVPLDQLTYTREIDTDVFGNKQASDGGPNRTTSGGTITTETDDGGTTTATTDENRTTTTTTDDGILGLIGPAIRSV